jgi:hypothetical protein
VGGSPPDDDATAAAGDGGEVAGPPERPDGPWDVAERPIDEDDEARVDLGALSVPAHPGVELRLQVDEASGQVASAMLVAADGALELRAFAAPRHEDIWEDIRPRIAAEATRLGGTATQVEGPFGTALELRVPGMSPDGQRVTQQSTVIGIPGPRWLLRVSMFGRPAVDFQHDGVLETALRGVVVVRGNQPMAPGDALPLRLPGNARRMAAPS